MSKFKVTHIPQVGAGGAFEVVVDNEKEAYVVYNALANQHLWLFENGYIPDYSNMIFVQMEGRGGKWEDYYNDELDMDWDEYVIHRFDKHLNNT